MFRSEGSIVRGRRDGIITQQLNSHQQTTKNVQSGSTIVVQQIEHFIHDIDWQQIIETIFLRLKQTVHMQNDS